MIPQMLPFLFLSSPPLGASPPLLPKFKSPPKTQEIMHCLPSKQRQFCHVPPAPQPPSLLPYPAPSNPAGTWGSWTVEGALSIWHLHGLCDQPPHFDFEGLCWGSHLPLTGLWSQAGSQQNWKHRTRLCRPGGRDCSVPCAIVLLKDYLVLVFVCHRGNCVGAGMGAGWQRAQFGIKGATSL